MKQSFNEHWFFYKKHIDNPEIEINPAEEAFSVPADAFVPVQIPHDWLIWNTNDLYEQSVGIYRREFSLSAKDVTAEPELGADSTFAERRFFLRFDGVYMDTTVFVNGKQAIEWKYGYTTFEADITPFVVAGTNTVTVVSVYKAPNSRWYSGAGIFRDVWLISVPQAHLVSDGIAIGNTHNADGTWTTSVQTEAVLHTALHIPKSADHTTKNEQKPLCARIKHTLLCADGTQAAASESEVQLVLVRTEENPFYFIDNVDPHTGTAQGVCVNKQTLHVQNIHEWDIKDPYLYTLKTQLITEINGTETVIDETIQHTGFRTIRFDSESGFYLNGRSVKIHGVCQHHDLGSLGAAFNIHALKRQFELLKKMGVNSIRTSHNPPAPAFMELADSMGILIDSECFDMWEKSKTPYDYARFFPTWHARDAASWLRRDRNHPSIIMWSIGNEIYDTHQGNGIEITKKLSALVQTFDPFRIAPTTIGSNYIEWEGAQRCMQFVGTAGYNYSERLYAQHHKKYPHWCIYGSETSSTVQSRGVYHFPASFRTLTHDDSQCSSLNNCSANWGALNAAKAITDDRDATFCSGQYLWTGWDYIGEPTPYFTKNSFFGQIDTAGFPKDTFYLYQAEWAHDAKPMIHLLPYWDFNESQLIDVRAYSNMNRVELFLNRKSLGAQNIDHEHGTRLAGEWTVPYQKGTLRAVAYDKNGAVVATEEQTTPGDSARIVALPDKSAFTDTMARGSETDLIFIEISTVDAQGNPVPNARNRIHVSAEGAVLAGLDNGDSTDYEQYKGDSRRLFNNKLLAIIAPEPQESAKSARAVVTITSAGLPPCVLVLGDTENTTATSQPKTTQTPQTEANATQNNERVPVRKIELHTDGITSLNADHQTVTVTALLFPLAEYGERNKEEYKNLLWQPMRLEGITSPCASITVDDTDARKAVVRAVSDGNFRLRCSCTNGTSYPEIISELEFSVSGMGSGTLSPYSFVSACECSVFQEQPKLSFQGGVYMSEGRSWIGFERVDFGDDGSDTLTMPLFAFADTLTVELWDGTPENGTLLSELEYTAKSWYNHYQPNTWTLPRRLFGLHTISFVTKNKLSIQGFSFARTAKAFAQLFAQDANRISGDTFTKDGDAITGIGNNVSLEFEHMNFGSSGASRLYVYGRSPAGANTVHVRFTAEEADGAENTSDDKSKISAVQNCILEIPQTSEYCETITCLSDQAAGGRICGKQKVTFIFLPGSCFDFKYFRFE